MYFEIVFRKSITLSGSTAEQQYVHRHRLNDSVVFHAHSTRLDVASSLHVIRQGSTSVGYPFSALSLFLKVVRAAQYGRIVEADFD